MRVVSACIVIMYSSESMSRSLRGFHSWVDIETDESAPAPFNGSLGFALSQTYAVSRFMNAVQVIRCFPVSATRPTTMGHVLAEPRRLSGHITNANQV